MYDDTPAPLKAEPTLMPSTLTRPSLERPPSPAKHDHARHHLDVGRRAAWLTLFGISCISPLYDREAGIALMMSLSSTIWRRTALHVDDGRLAGDGDRLGELADRRSTLMVAVKTLRGRCPRA